MTASLFLSKREFTPVIISRMSLTTEVSTDSATPWSFALMTMLATKRTPLVSGHSAGRMRLPSSASRLCRLGQSARWMTTPLPRVTNPTIASPGTGLQHPAKRVRRPVMPLTMTPPESACASPPR